MVIDQVLHYGRLRRKSTVACAKSGMQRLVHQGDCSLADLCLSRGFDMLGGM